MIYKIFNFIRIDLFINDAKTIFICAPAVDPARRQD